MGSPWKETWDKEVCVGGLFGSWCQGMNNIAKDQSMVYYLVGHIVGSRVQFHQDTLKNMRKASKNYLSEHWHFLIAVYLHWLRLVLSVCGQGHLSSTSMLLLVHAFKLDYTSASPHTPPLLAVLEKHIKQRKYSVHLGQNAFFPKWAKAAVKPEVWPRGYETGTQGVLFSIRDKLPCLGPVSGLRSLVPNPAKGRRMLYSGLWGLWFCAYWAQ